MTNTKTTLVLLAAITLMAPAGARAADLGSAASNMAPTSADSAVPGEQVLGSPTGVPFQGFQGPALAVVCGCRRVQAEGSLVAGEGLLVPAEPGEGDALPEPDPAHPRREPEGIVKELEGLPVVPEPGLGHPPPEPPEGVLRLPGKALGKDLEGLPVLLHHEEIEAFPDPGGFSPLEEVHHV